MSKWLAYTFMCAVLTFVFTGATVLIWWAAQFGYWWGLAGTCVIVGIFCGTMLMAKDSAKLNK